MKNRNAPTNLQSETQSKVPTVALAKNCKLCYVEIQFLSEKKTPKLDEYTQSAHVLCERDGNGRDNT